VLVQTVRAPAVRQRGQPDPTAARADRSQE
jgi:hypothetical protein